jgi:predicted RecB family nuclease
LRLVDKKWILSPRDLIAELECNHRLNLEWGAITGLIDKPKEDNDPALQLVIDNGIAHEERLVEDAKKKGSLVSIFDPGFDIEKINKALEETLSAIKQGIEVIHQAVLFTGDFLGYADFLVLTKDESANPVKDEKGRLIYEPVDAKSARIAKRAAVLQVASYARAMVRLDLAMPPKVHLWLAGDAKWSANTADLIDLAEEFENRARSRVTSFKDLNNPNWAAPREACTRCRWQEHCATGRVKDRDLSLIYGIRSSTRLALIEGGIKTIDEMSTANDESRKTLKKNVSKETFEKLRDQAKLQIKGEGLETPIFELRDKEALRVIPASSQGDIWFDMEGDPYSASGEGLEYMFGYLIDENGKLNFKTFEAKTKAEEKKAFADFISFVIERSKKYPDLHIYHYAAYEPSTILRLSQKYGIYENEVDDLKRQGVFVDLLSVVRKALRFSTDSLSIKSIEQLFFPGHRSDEVATAMESVIQFNLAALDLINGNTKAFEERLKNIRDYNEVDCRSLHSLDDWLRKQAQENGIELLALYAREEEQTQVIQEEVDLLEGVPEDKEQRSVEHQGAALLSSAVSYHRREDKPTWWNIFDKAVKDLDELEAFDDVILFEEISTSNWSQVPPQRTMHRYTEITSTASGDLRHIFDKGDRPHLLYDISHEKMLEVAGSTRSICSTAIEKIEESKLTLDETCKPTIQNWQELPIAILPEAPVDASKIADVIRTELATRVITNKRTEQETFPNEAWADILLRKPPRQNKNLLPDTDNPIADITNALLDSKNSYVAVQGPPGTGKTYVGARVIAKLIKEHGWRVGVVAQSHAVIENLLNSIQKFDSTIPIAKTCKQPTNRPTYHQDKVAPWANTQTNGFVIGGTAWTFASQEVRNLNLDLVVVDEAGQFSLANTIASISCARTALLLGDPQQLPQVSQGSHPEPVNESALQHLLGDAKTMPKNMGYFLETTYRLHPLLAKKVSRLQYEDRLHADPRCEKRKLEGVDPGLHIINIEHEGNTTRSTEEGEAIVEKIKEVLGKEWIDTDQDGNQKPARKLDQQDILIVTAYNAQVKYLKSLMNKNGWHNIAVGSFDKFQGREAPVVLVSMATSTAEDLPRGIEFLLSPNRLNVAVSRAQWACYLYRSTNLSVMEPSSPDGMVMLGKFVSLCKLYILRC